VRDEGKYMKISERNRYYTQEFYDGLNDGSIQSARIILGLLYKFYQPKSVIDIGCGHGGWLAAAESLGSTILKGIDGDWVDPRNTLSKNINFENLDLEKQSYRGQRYELCISLEVAEHIPESQSQLFINSLCNASDVVLFSAAIKFQGGTNHINEQWQSYWGSLFQENSYQCFDILRNRIWEEKKVKWWYRQNIFVFVNSKNVPTGMNELESLNKTMLNLVHPINYERAISSYQKLIQNPPLRFSMGCIKRWFFNAIKTLGNRDL
jgi:SAM-dependent methyltransferase